MLNNETVFLIDFRNFCIKWFYESINEPDFPDFFREKYTMDDFILRDIREAIAEKSNITFGRIFFVMDAKVDGNYWKNSIFEHYKKNRKENQYEEKLQKLEQYFLKHYFLNCLRYDKCEADDIIAVFCKKYFDRFKEIFIISTDQDMDFLTLDGSNIYRISSIETFGRHRVPLTKEERFAKFVRGDRGDGIPNILSEADCIVEKGKRQKTISKKKLEEIILDIKTGNPLLPDVQKAYIRNKMLMDFDMLHPKVFNKLEIYLKEKLGEI